MHALTSEPCPSLVLQAPALRTRSLLLACVLALPLAATAQISAGRVMSVSGDVRVVDAQGKARALEKGAEIRAGEKIITADGALTQIRLNDGGFMSVRPGTEMVIDRFQYDEKNASNSSMLVSLLRGGMRSISGLIGKTNPDGYQIKSGTATVGIRGTDHEPMVIPAGVPELAKLGLPGLYDKVNDGETFIRNQAGLLSIKRGEIGFAAAAVANMAPQALKVIPEFYKLDLKVDARDPKEAASIDAQGRRELAPASGGLLRPTTAARREALVQSGTVLQPLNTGTLSEKTLSTTTISPTLSSTLIAPTTTTTVEPTKTLSTTNLISPTTTTNLQTLSSTTPTLSTSTLSTTTLVAPTTTLVAPTTTLIAPTTTLVAPTTTTISPTTSTLSTTTLSSPLLSTTTIKTLK